MKFAICFTALFAHLWFLIGAVAAEKRVALVIGNSAYETISPLANPKNDAALIASTLEGVGFEVATAIDVDYGGMRKAVQQFGRSLRSAGKDAVGLVYYAGHGVQARGTNYLIPLGADIQSDADLDLSALSASQVLAQMEAAGNALNLVILDACRNNPFEGRVRSGGRGLARIQAASGSLVAFAAGPGQVADDGRGANSPYTRALVDAINEPGLTVEQVFKRVRIKVESQTGGAQTPWEESSLRGEFYFSKPVPKPEPAPVVTVPQVDKEVVFWNSVKDSTSPAVLQAYVDRYPDGTFSGLAKVLIARLTAEAERERQRQDPQKLAALTTPAVAEPDRPETPSEMVALGIRYETGDGISRDSAKAAKWFREAARSGDAEAKYRLGLLYYRGEGVGRSFTEAAVQILDAVQANHRPAVTEMLDAVTLNDPTFLKAIQQRLKVLGYYRNSADGKWGPGSRSAIAALSQGKSPTTLDRSASRPNTNSDASRSGSTRPAASAPAAKPNSGSSDVCTSTGIAGLFPAGYACPGRQ